MPASKAPENLPPDNWQAKADWHRRQARLPMREKVRILLALQQQDLPLISRHRPLHWWERPWEVEP